VGLQPRVGEIKLEEIADRRFVRKLDDSGLIDLTSNATLRSIPEDCSDCDSAEKPPIHENSG